MKFDTRTTQILRNFSTINASLIFKPGDTITTISPHKTVMAKATTSLRVEDRFAIYDLPQFLGAVGMFDDPDLIQEGKQIIITEGKEKIKYTCAAEHLILAPPEKDIKFPPADVSFELKADMLGRIQKALGIISVPEIAITGDGENIYLEAINSKNASDSTYRVEVGVTDKTFRAIFLSDHIKPLPDDYTVSISSAGLSHWKSADVQYWIAIESTSTFEK
jgi:hypothetical protein